MTNLCAPYPCRCRSTSGPPPPPCRQTPGLTSLSPASLFALQTRSTSPQPTHASPDSTYPCTPRSNCSELNCCRLSPPRCLALCRSFNQGQPLCTRMCVTWPRCHLIDQLHCGLQKSLNVTCTIAALLPLYNTYLPFSFSIAYIAESILLS